MSEFLAICKRHLGYAMLFSMFVLFPSACYRFMTGWLASYSFSDLVVITFAAIISLMTLAAL